MRRSGRRRAPLRLPAQRLSWKDRSTYSLPLDVGCALSRLVEEVVRRHDAPDIRGRRILAPDLRLLRPVLVPRPRFEIAEFLVVDAVEFGEQFDDLPIRIAVIGEQIVADAMPPRAPDQRVALGGEEVAGGLQMPPIAQFEGNVV